METPARSSDTLLVQTRLAEIGVALDDIAAVGVAPSTGADAIELVRSVESVARRVDALRTDVLDGIDRSRTYGTDGHVSAKAMLKHHADISAVEARDLHRISKVRELLPTVSGLFAAGEVSSDKMAVLGKLWSNTRVRDAIGDADEWFADRAQVLKFDDFKQLIRQWELLMDADGAKDKNELTHARRDFYLAKGALGEGWTAKGSFGSLQGAELDEILKAYIKAEWEADWEAAKAIHGDDTTPAHLARTPGQRRADAIAQVFTDATAAKDSPVGADHTHNIVWSAEAFQETLNAIEQEREAEYDIDTFKCETTDGIQLEPTEAAINALFNKIRRVVVDAKGVVIDLGRARLFTGHARQAAILQSTSCIWPGCHRPSTHCEIDHLHDYASGGRTNPGNGAPLCGRHNRHKQKGFTITRLPNGALEIRRQDGTILE